MNIIEAAKSGKRYKRIGGGEWLNPNGSDLLTFADAIANDYIVEEKTVTVSATTVLKALNTAARSARDTGFSDPDKVFVDEVLKQLGLE